MSNQTSTDGISLEEYPKPEAYFPELEPEAVELLESQTSGIIEGILGSIYTKLGSLGIGIGLQALEDYRHEAIAFADNKYRVDNVLRGQAATLGLFGTAAFFGMPANFYTYAGVAGAMAVKKRINAHQYIITNNELNEIFSGTEIDRTRSGIIKKIDRLLGRTVFDANKPGVGNFRIEKINQAIELYEAAAKNDEDAKRKLSQIWGSGFYLNEQDQLGEMEGADHAIDYTRSNQPATQAIVKSQRRKMERVINWIPLYKAVTSDDVEKRDENGRITDGARAAYLQMFMRRMPRHLTKNEKLDLLFNSVEQAINGARLGTFSAVVTDANHWSQQKNGEIVKHMVETEGQSKEFFIDEYSTHLANEFNTKLHGSSQDKRNWLMRFGNTNHKPVIDDILQQPFGKGAVLTKNKDLADQNYFQATPQITWQDKLDQNGEKAILEEVLKDTAAKKLIAEKLTQDKRNKIFESYAKRKKNTDIDSDIFSLNAAIPDYLYQRIFNSLAQVDQQDICRELEANHKNLLLNTIAKIEPVEFYNMTTSEQEEVIEKFFNSSNMRSIIKSIIKNHPPTIQNYQQLSSTEQSSLLVRIQNDIELRKKIIAQLPSSSASPRGAGSPNEYNKYFVGLYKEIREEESKKQSTLERILFNTVTNKILNKFGISSTFVQEIINGILGKRF